MKSVATARGDVNAQRSLAMGIGKLPVLFAEFSFCTPCATPLTYTFNLTGHCGRAIEYGALVYGFKSPHSEGHDCDGQIGSPSKAFCVTRSAKKRRDRLTASVTLSENRLLALVHWRRFLKCCEQLFRAVGHRHSIVEDNVLSCYVLAVQIPVRTIVRSQRGTCQ